MSDLSEEMLEGYRGELESRRAFRTGKELSVSTVKCIIMLVNRGLEEARRAHGLRGNMKGGLYTGGKDAAEADKRTAGWEEDLSRDGEAEEPHGSKDAPVPV